MSVNTGSIHSEFFNLSDYISSNVEACVAIEYKGESFTYSSLDKRVSVRVAMLEKSISAGNVVAIRRDKSTNYVIDMLAAMTCGAIVMPIDPELPVKRQNTMLDIVAPSAIIEDDGSIVALPNRVSPRVPANKGPGAYIFFTSGSTGLPKAILGSLHALISFIRWQGDAFKISPGDRVSFLTALGFDVSLRDILLPLLNGATLVIPAKADLESPHSTATWLVQSKITHAHAVPSIARLWARAGDAQTSSLRVLFLAGEKLLSSTLYPLREAFPSVEEFVNLYGPTETTLAKFFYRLPSDFKKLPEEIPVGRPLPGTAFHLTKEAEIVIETADASFGYLKANEAEKSRFAKLEDKTVHYATGDLGRINKDDLLVVVGRIDDQVKVNGVRVHPNEVAQTVLHCPVVQDAVIVGVPPQSSMQGDMRLAAFWTSMETGNRYPDNAPRAHCNAYLPRAIVPTVWRKLSAIPLTPNGKTNRQALLNLLLAPTPKFKQQRFPKTTIEHWLVNALSDLLSIEKPGLESDIFALGATSMHIAFLIGRIEKDLKKKVDFADLFNISVLSELAKLLEQSSALIKLTPKKTGRRKRYNLSPQQRRWWNIYIPEGNRSWATIVRVIGLGTDVTTASVQQAFFALLKAQVSLRLWFDKSPVKLSLAVHDCKNASDITVREHDFHDDNSETAKKNLDKIRLEIANSEIATDKWPLFRIVLVRMPAGKNRLVFAIHHMISDGFSMGIIEDYLHQWFDGGRQDSAPSLPFARLSFDYLDYAQWAANREKTVFGPGSQAESYWRKVFAKPYHKHVFPELWKGLGHDRGQGFSCAVPDEIRQSVINFSRDSQVTEFSIYLAAKMRAWQHILGRDDLVIGTPAAGRNLSGTESIIGNFISLVCIRSQLKNTYDSREYVRNIMRDVAAGMTHQGYQYDTLVKSLGLSFGQARFPLTTIFISYLNFEAGKKLPLLNDEPGFSDLGFAVKFDLMAYVREHLDATSLQIQYRNNLFNKADIKNFTNRWIYELEKITGTVKSANNQNF